MLRSSATFRYVLALLMALWSPVCLCHAGPEAAPPVATTDHAAAEADHDHHEHHEHHDHHYGCPGHDPSKSACGCQQISAAVAKAGLTFKCSGDLVVFVLHWVHGDAFTAARGWGGCVRPVATVPRPPTSLLRLHCSLTV